MVLIKLISISTNLFIIVIRIECQPHSCLMKIYNVFSLSIVILATIVYNYCAHLSRVS